MSTSKTITPLDGWLVIHKPLGMTSTKVTSFVKKKFSLKKIGHVGTLDPLASGVLTLALGEATKLIPYWGQKQKEYVFEVTFGELRSTDDAEGDVLKTSPVMPALEAIPPVLKTFLGSIQQVPPRYSAIHIQGKRAYDLARSNQTFDMPSRIVHINDLRCLGQKTENTFLFKVLCGPGTYVRSLARDIAKELGTYGYVSSLQRTYDCPFSLNHSIMLENLKDLEDNMNGFYKMDFVLDDIPDVSISKTNLMCFRQGKPVSLDQTGMIFLSGKIVKVFCEKIFHGMGFIDETGNLLAKRVLNINFL